MTETISRNKVEENKHNSPLKCYKTIIDYIKWQPFSIVFNVKDNTFKKSKITCITLSGQKS